MPVSKAQQKAVTKYMKENYDEIKIRVPKGQKDVLKVYAKQNNTSVNKLIQTLIYKELSERSNVNET